jgi:hypothetical protein
MPSRRAALRLRQFARFALAPRWARKSSTCAGVKSSTRDSSASSQRLACAINCDWFAAILLLGLEEIVHGRTVGSSAGRRRSLSRHQNPASALDAKAEQNASAAAENSTPGR